MLSSVRGIAYVKIQTPIYCV